MDQNYRFRYHIPIHILLRQQCRSLLTRNQYFSYNVRIIDNSRKSFSSSIIRIVRRIVARFSRFKSILRARRTFVYTSRHFTAHHPVQISADRLLSLNQSLEFSYLFVAQPSGVSTNPARIPQLEILRLSRTQEFDRNKYTESFEHSFTRIRRCLPDKHAHVNHFSLLDNIILHYIYFLQYL